MGLFTRKITVNKAINKCRTLENAYLIDCREKVEYKNGHISGAINCPIDKITEENILRRFPDKTSQFYIVGSYTQRPGEAVKKFKKLGYKNALLGGYMEEHHGMLTK
ncbi:MAG: rhodanese-like domain-containing protein [Lachnospiraceae bacterium]|nr:rhodanese-like domain-containing protein [Lachnospiraceae bacterium]